MLKLQNINAYYGYIHALKDVSIEVEQGKIVTLLGANGAGKTSILKVISGLLKPMNGSVIFENEDITNLQPEKIVRKQIIQAPEGRQIFPELTVKENLQVGAFIRKDKKEVANTLEIVYQYFPILKEREKQVAGTLSGGEQQMLAIGRALMARPKLLLLDEPSLGLAPLIVKNIFEIIKKINQEGTTILLVEQNAFQSLAISHYAYILETGKVVHSQNSDDLRNDPKIKQAYLGNI